MTDRGVTEVTDCHAVTFDDRGPARFVQIAPGPGDMKDGTREVIETIVFVVVLVLLLKTFLAEAFVIPTGSMAETLWGYQKLVSCPKCGEPEPDRILGPPRFRFISIDESTVKFPPVRETDLFVFAISIVCLASAFSSIPPAIFKPFE